MISKSSIGSSSAVGSNPYRSQKRADGSLDACLATQVVTHASGGALSAAECNPLNAVVRLIVDSFLQNTFHSLQDHLLKQAFF